MLFVESSAWPLMGAHSTFGHSEALKSMVPWWPECSWEPMSTHGTMASCSWMLMSTHRHSWALMGVLMYFHEYSWELISIHECILVLKSSHESTLVANSTHSATLMSASGCSWLLMVAHEHSLALISTYKQQWKIMGMAPWHQQDSWAKKSIHEHSAISTHSAFTPFSPVLMRAQECPLVLRIAHGRSWVTISAFEWSWVFKFLIE